MKAKPEKIMIPMNEPITIDENTPLDVLEREAAKGNPEAQLAVAL